MKKFLVFLAAMLLVFGVVGTASAVPTTWTDSIDWDPNIPLSDAGFFQEGSDHHDYFHDLGNDGFVGYLEGGNDIIVSYNLRVALYDDDNSREVARIFQPGIPFLEPNMVTTYDFSWDFADIGWTVVGLVDINHDGTLNIRVEPVRGDFYLDWSTINAHGDNGDAPPVPEPATMLLLGSGLIGLAGLGRKKLFKKS